MSDPHVVRQQALKLLEGLEGLDQPELLVMPVLLDAIALVEAYRFVRHKDVAQLPELTSSVDGLMTALQAMSRADEPAEEAKAQYFSYSSILRSGPPVGAAPTKQQSR